MNVFDYLVSLPSKVLQELYEDPWTCQAIFRSLPNLSKSYILRLLFVNVPPQGISVHNWIKNTQTLSSTNGNTSIISNTSTTSNTFDNATILQSHKKALERLLSLRLCHQVTEKPITKTSTLEGVMIQLNPVFQQQLKVALSQAGSPPWIRNTSGMKTDKHAPTLKALGDYSKMCWEALLRFMIGKPTHSPSPNIAEILLKTDLMTIEKDENLRITNKGFQFLLKDTYTQIWTLLLAYIETTESRNMNKKEVLSFLFQLSFLTFGKDYPVENLTATQRTLLNDLREFGIIYQRKKSSGRFYPTQLAITVSTGKTDIQEHEETSKFVVLEANYRLYAYTSNELQISILSLFTKMKYRLPNLSVGAITRESIRTALVHGITANEIIQYLYQHAHPEQAKNFPVIPETVSDQIRLWEAERNRVTYDRGVLLDGFRKEDIFLAILKYSKDTGIYIWHDPKKQLLMVTENGSDAIKAFMKKHFN